MGAKGIGTHDMGTLGIGATDLGSLSISRPGTDALGMPPMPVHSTILHAPRLPGRHEKTRFLPLPKTAHPHATNPAGQVVETGKGLTFALGDDARRHGWPDAAQGLQLLGRGAVGVDSRVGSEGGVGDPHQVGSAALSENVHVAANAHLPEDVYLTGRARRAKDVHPAGNVRLDGIQDGGGRHNDGPCFTRGKVRRPCRSSACQQPRKQRQKRQKDGDEPGKTARRWRQGSPCPEDGLHGEPRLPCRPSGCGTPKGESLARWRGPAHQPSGRVMLGQQEVRKGAKGCGTAGRVRRRFPRLAAGRSCPNGRSPGTASSTAGRGSRRHGSHSGSCAG